MNFARRQLEKYGWSDGKGLGKHENGISEALKPKLKRSVTGLGHDPASEFNEHWWSALYDKAAKNVKVKEKNGATKNIKTIDHFTITNSTWKINRNQKDSSGNEYSQYFIKRTVLENGRSEEEKVGSDSEEGGGQREVFRMTDEQLFAACRGRTAHKGARHGLKALGKLARIAEQEQNLLTQPQYAGYSHAKKIKKSKPEEIVEDTSIDDIEGRKTKKKRKRKRCVSNESGARSGGADAHSLARRRSGSVACVNVGDASEIQIFDLNRKSSEDNMEAHTGVRESDIKEKNKKRKLRNAGTAREQINCANIVEHSTKCNIQKKKKKRKDDAEPNNCNN